MVLVWHHIDVGIRTYLAQVLSSVSLDNNGNKKSDREENLVRLAFEHGAYGRGNSRSRQYKMRLTAKSLQHQKLIKLRSMMMMEILSSECEVRASPN